MPEQPTNDPSPTVDGTSEPITPAPGASKRAALFKRFGGAFLAILAFFAIRAFTADDGTHGIKAGECVAAVGSDDFKKIDCGDPTSLGTVTFIQTDTATDESSALSLCEKHGARGAFTSTVADGGTGTVVCVSDPR